MASMGSFAVVIAGSPCAGKTTLAAAMATQLRAVLIDKDTVEWPLANAALAAAGLEPFAHGSELYTSVLKHAAYETMERIAAQNTACGLPVVLVAPFSSHVKEPEWQPRLQAKLGVQRLLVLWVTASHESLLARKAARGEGRDLVDGPDGNPALFAATEAARSPPVGSHQLIDTTEVPPEDMPELAMRTLQTLLGTPPPLEPAGRDGAESHRTEGGDTAAAPPPGVSSSVSRSAALHAAVGGGGVVCAGHACIDVVMSGCDELPSREGYAAVDRFTLCPGGAVSNTSMQLARLGVPVNAMTVLGDDEFGTLLLAAWEAAGVCTERYVSRSGSAPTSCAALPVYKADAKRAVYACQGTNAYIDGDSLLPKSPVSGAPDVSILGSHQFFLLGYPHIMPLLQGSSLREFLCRVAEHVPVALDVNEAFDDPALPLGGANVQNLGKPFAPVAVLHCNLEEAAACLNRKAELMAKAAQAAGVLASEVNLEAWVTAEDVAELAGALLEQGVGLVLITLGANGAYGACCQDETRLRTLLRQSCPADMSKLLGCSLLVPAFEALGEVNSVGAGDSFLAGVVAALCHFSTYGRALSDASQLCADGQTAGGPTGVPASYSLAEILRCGCASAVYRVDGGRGDCPVLPALLGELRMGVHGMLEELPLANAALRALLAEPVITNA